VLARQYLQSSQLTGHKKKILFTILGDSVIDEQNNSKNNNNNHT